MSKINQIQNALKELDGGKFQKLCDCYLIEKGYANANLNPIGSVFGADKVRKGTPDTAIRDANGKFILVEYTTSQNNLFDKLSSDIKKCLDEEKTGIKIANIQQIILCITTGLTLQEEQKLHQQVKNSKISLKIYDMESLSFDLYRHFPGLAKDFLGVNIDTGQIITITDFVLNYDKSYYSTPLNTDFCFRDKEVEKALSNLNSNNLLLISGSAGVGKSRLALEIIHQFNQRNPEYQSFCIRDRGQDLFDDLQIYFSRPGSFLIFVDDANRIGGFNYITQLLQDCKQNKQIKVVATVRDYAIEKVRRTTQLLNNVSEINLSAFEKEQIRELIQKLYNISNGLWLDRICEVASGNPRIAVMAAKVAIEENNLNSIKDVSSLYDRYFSSIRDDLQELDDPNILKCAGIISLFKSIDKANDKLMRTIWKAFNIDSHTLWQLAQRLHELELVDIYEEEVVKIKDQVLATYLFYLCVFKQKAIDLKIILEQLFPNQINRIQDAIYSCLNAFDYEQLEKQIRPVILDQWTVYRKNNKDDNLRQLIRTFWFLLQTDALLYIHEKVQLIELEPFDITTINWDVSSSIDRNSILSLLSHFYQADNNNLKLALEIICDYIERKPKIVADLVFFLSTNFGFRRYSHYQNYNKQHMLIDMLIKRTKDGENILFSKLLIALSKKLLYTYFDDKEATQEVITIYQYNLHAIPSLLELRKKMWTHLFKLFNKKELQPDIIDLLICYCRSGYYINVKEIADYDCKLLIPFFSTKLDPKNWQSCLIVQNYIKFATDKELNSNTSELSKLFYSEKYHIYKLLSLDYLGIKDNIDLQNFEKFKRDEIDKYTRQFKLEDYKLLLLTAQDIYYKMKNNREKYQLLEGLKEIFSTLAYKNNPALYVSVITYYLAEGESFNFACPIPLIRNLITIIGVEETKKLLEKNNFPTKIHWLFAFYQTLKIEQIKPEHINQLYALYEKAGPGEVPFDFDYLLNYLAKDNSAIVNIIGILLNRASANQNFGHSLHALFNPYMEVNKQLLHVFKGNEIMVKQAYLTHARMEPHIDHNGQNFNRILNIDPKFLLEYIDHIYSDSEYPEHYDDLRDYSFLWRRKDIKKIMTSAIQRILSYGSARGYRVENYLKKLFCVSESQSVSQDIKEKQDIFIKAIVDKNAYNMDMMSLIYGTITHFEVERRTQLVAHFLAKNQNIEDFKILPLEPSVWGWSDSAVPMITARITYLESLLPYCNSTSYLVHKKYIEERIREIQRHLEAEKKSDFLKD
ncbi:hypothetical protein ACNVED_05170 [Legionella sp. D16C41]|uniref:nSTAND3 domain-containing NTPase n=1 Tax=Legionella sp. D16C41 TaxID=3402688 RepID=UPI003AF99934